MKTCPISRYFAIGVAATLPILNGCTQQGASGSSTYITTTSAAVPAEAQPVPPSTAEAPSATPVEPVMPANIELTNAPAIAEAEAAPPPSLRVSKALGEVIHLAQSGVDEAIILTYVTNSPAAFQLGAEEIVYLKDLGITSSVITSMMQRDQVLKSAAELASESAAPAAVVAISNATPVAAAPAYVNPPASAPMVEAQPIYASNNYFYDSLSPYGSWVEIDGYGRCWRPTVVVTSPSWRPYCDGGRWVHTDSGWYWMSDYSWGSVAFHYGRWFSHPRWGWCWWPDTVWAPSWVTWRYDNDNCGWAPLPPNSIYTPGVGFTYFGRSVGLSFDFQLGIGAFTFVPWGRFCDPHPYRYCLERPRSVAIYNHTTIVNNYARGRSASVALNQGISPDRVREHTRSEIRTVKIRDENIRTSSPRPERFEAGGRALVVHRPSLSPQESIVTSPTRTDARSGQPRQQIGTGTASRVPSTQYPVRQEREAVTARSGRNSQNAPSVVRIPPAGPSENASPAPVRTPTPVTRPTPIFSRPLVVETRPQTSTRPTQNTPVQNTPTIIGGSRGSRGSGRDYSVWSTPTPQPTPQPSTPNVAPSFTTRPAQNSSADRSPLFNSPNRTVPRPDVSPRMERPTMAERPRSEVRTITPAAPAPVIAPRQAAPPVIAPAPVRPVNIAPATPPPSAPRVESRPAPSRSDTPDANRGRR